MPTAHRKDTPSSMTKVLELKPLMMVLSLSPIREPKMVTARTASRPTLILRKNPIRITAIRTSKEINAKSIWFSSLMVCAAAVAFRCRP